MPFPGGSVKQTKTAVSQPRSPFLVNELYGVGLFLRDISNHWQFEHLTLIGFEQKNDPEDEASHPNDQMQRQCYQHQERNDREDGKCDHDGNHGNAKEDALERVKADEA